MAYMSAQMRARREVLRMRARQPQPMLAWRSVLVGVMVEDFEEVVYGGYAGGEVFALLWVAGVCVVCAEAVEEESEGVFDFAELGFGGGDGHGAS